MKGTETTCELLNVFLKLVLNLIAGAKLDDDAGRTLGDALEFAGGLFAVGAPLGKFVDRAKVEDLDTGMGGLESSGMEPITQVSMAS